MSGCVIGNTCVFGLSWGDEGKGKIVDLLAPHFKFVVRFNGGANAGHTVCVDEEKYALHLLPTGVLHEHTVGVIGPGVAVDPLGLIEEIDALGLRGIEVDRKLKISERAHLVMAYHKIEDRLSERACSSGTRLGTTARGIGPCYADKMKRTTAIRFIDLLHGDDLSGRVRRIVATKKASFQALYDDDDGLDAEAVLADVEKARARLTDLITDTTELLNGAIQSNQQVLFEGANGLLLDVDHGTYPYVTSSSTGPHGIGAGAGVPPSVLVYRIGVTKAYSTRVGAGPFVSELADATGDRIRKAGHEYGTTTGRPRRCGWFDAVSIRYSAMVSDATHIALMHLDTLSGFSEVGLCVSYRIVDQTVQSFPSCTSRLEQAEPIVEMLPGWDGDLRSIRSFDALPSSARAYVRRIESVVGVPVAIIGVGPDRSQTLVRDPLRHVFPVPETSTV